MIKFLDFVAMILSYVAVFFSYRMISELLSPRLKGWWQLLAFLPCSVIFNMVIYANDLWNILGTYGALLVYLLCFYKGPVIHKFSVSLMLYPMIVAVNFLTHDLGYQAFLLSGDTSLMMSTLTHTASIGLRVSIWYLGLVICRRWGIDFSDSLDTKSWLMIDSICLTVAISILTVIGFAPETIQLTYPVSFASIVTIFGCLYLVGYIANAMAQQFQLEAMQAEHHYYEEKFAAEERIQAIYHDMKNSLLLAREEAGEAGAEKIIDTLERQLTDYENYYQTGNRFLDIIIRDKAQTAQTKEIDFSAMVDFAEGDFMAPLDISTIFGNLLDNAIEASQQLQQQERVITLKVNKIREMLVIRMDNNAHSNEDKSFATTKKDQKSHGFGLKNIRRSVAKYGGECTFEQTEGLFSTKILIPLP